jgi:hypothetical protein
MQTARVSASFRHGIRMVSSSSFCPERGVEELCAGPSDNNDCETITQFGPTFSNASFANNAASVFKSKIQARLAGHQRRIDPQGVH